MADPKSTLTLKVDASEVRRAIEDLRGSVSGPGSQADDSVKERAFEVLKPLLLDSTGYISVGDIRCAVDALAAAGLLRGEG